MDDLASLRSDLESSFAAVEALCESLQPGEWGAQSLCPDWTMRDVVSHLAQIEAVLAGWLPASAEGPPPFARAGEFAQATAGLDHAGFAEAVHAQFDVRRADLAALEPSDVERPSWTPLGPATYGRFLGVRVFDFWVHERDISVPLGRASDDSGPRAERAVDEVAGSLGYIVGKKIGLPDGHSIAFHLTGPVVRGLCVVVDGRARVVDDIDAPDVELTTDSLTFVQLACGRIDPQGPIDAGTIRWSGDEGLGDRAARNLRFTM
ncbi:MAG: maleylpyruvate isomerase family mycothiol-dependent enzyme [Acidimicrobiales bacterium]